MLHIRETERHMKTIRAILCRHTETELNRENRYTGQLNVPLNSTGESQAKILADLLAHKNVEAIFSSDLQRAIQTASYIAARHISIPSKTDARLREIDLGVASGMLKNDVRRLYPDEKFSTQSPYFDFSKIGGESRKIVVKRQIEFFDEATQTIGAPKRYAPNIIIVGHGTVLRCFLEHLGFQSRLEQGNYQIIYYSVN